MIIPRGNNMLNRGEEKEGLNGENKKVEENKVGEMRGKWGERKKLHISGKTPEEEKCGDKGRGVDKEEKVRYMWKRERR